MKILIVDNGTKHLKKLKDLLYGNELEIIPFLSKYPLEKEYDLVILSGSSEFSIVSVPEVFKEEIKLIKGSKKPIIGICEGCEVIAYVYGSKLEFHERKSKGLREIKPLVKNQIFSGLEKLEVYEAHHWAITKLGKKLIGLARSRTGYEIIKLKDRKVYGFQFHPEMLKNESDGNELYMRVVNKLVGETKFKVD